jgi:hypothetical protein
MQVIFAVSDLTPAYLYVRVEDVKRPPRASRKPEAGR